MTTVPDGPRRDAATPASGVRASTAEREAVVRRLHAAVGDGRLDLAETEERVTAAYTARYRHELDPLVADLPPAAPPGWDELWTGAVARARALVLGPAAGDGPVTRRQSAVAGVVVAAGVAWLLLWLVLGLVVGALG